MANRTFNNVKLNLTLKTTGTRANLSSSSEDLAVQMGKIQKWFNDFSWAVWNAPFGDVYGPGNAVTSFSVTGPDDTDDPTLVGKISAYKGDTFIPRHGMADIGVLSLGLPVSGGRFGSIWATDIHNESSMTDYQTPLMIYRPQRSEMDIDEGEARGDIQIGYGFANEISQYALYGMNLYRSTNSTTYHHVGSTIISAGYKQYYVEIDGKWGIDAIGNKTISVVIPGSSDSIGGFNSDTYAAVWNSVYNGFTDLPTSYYNEYKDFGADAQFLIRGVSFKVTSTSADCGPYTYNNKDYIYATDSPGIIFSSGYNFGMLQIATSIDDHGHFPEGAAPPGTLIIAGGEPSNDSGVPAGTPIEEKHPDFAWGIHGTSGTVYDLDNLTATKLGTSTVGSSTRPIYLNAGVPTGVTQPATGAWWSSVPKIDSSGVLEIGKFIDFHATTASTNNYDYRLYASTTTLAFQSVSSEYTQIQLTSAGSSMIRFGTTASGKTCSAAKIAAYPLTTSGQVMLIESGGNTVIGSGEFASNAYARKDSTGTNAVGYDNLATSETEDLYLGADSDVHIIANGQNIGTYSNTDHKEWLFNTSGELNCPTGASITIPRSGGGGVMLHDQGFRIQVPNSSGFARSIQLYRGNWTTLLGGIGFYGSASATANDVEYYMGNDYTNPWYSFKKTAFTINTDVKFQVLSDQVKITDANDAGWSLIYKSSVSTLTGQVISCYPTESQYAIGLIIGETTGGLTIIGGGEAAYSLNNTIRDASTTPYGSALSYQSEALIMGADSDMYFVSGANTLTTSAHTEGTNLKTFIWSSSGTLRPWNDNTYSIGASTKRWNYGYFTNISGKLIGTIDSSTTATTQTLPNVTSRVATCQFAWNLYNNSGYFANDNTSSDTAIAAPWGCIAEVTVSNPGSGTWTYISTTFLIMAPWVENPGTSDPKVKTGPGTGILLFRASIQHTTATLDQYTLKWLESDENVNDKFIVLTSTRDTTNNTLTIKIWAYCPNRYMGYHIHPLYEATRAGRRTSEIWTYNSITTGVANYDTGTNVTVLKPTSPQTLLYESAASTATSLQCTVNDIFLRWKVVYVCVQGLSFGSGSNPISINFLVPLKYVKSKSNYNSAISSSNPGYYAGEGYNPSNSSGATRMLVQWKDDNTIVFTHGSGNRIGTIRIYGIS